LAKRVTFSSTQDTPQPAASLRAANLNDIGHHAIRGARVDGMLHIQHAPPVLAARDRRPCFARDKRMTRVVMRKRGLFYPDQTLVVRWGCAIGTLTTRTRMLLTVEFVASIMSNPS